VAALQSPREILVSSRPPTPPSDRPSSDPQQPEFEQALAELEQLVERLERGDLPLDEALKTFERGVALTRHCQTSLKAAQQKVEILLKKNGQAELQPFTAADESSDE
jgi:exodeoxyribonuclease VII small subunit